MSVLQGSARRGVFVVIAGSLVAAALAAPGSAGWLADMGLPWTGPEATSPVRRIDRHADARPLTHDPAPAGIPALEPSIDGQDNNLARPYFNAAGIPLRRRAANDYADGVAAPSGSERLSARTISNLVNAQDRPRHNRLGLSDFAWQWGQFVDHDIDLTDGVEPAEPMAIPVPPGDPWFDPAGTGTAAIELNRSIYWHHSGTGPDNPREQVNEITGWIDASMVYGSDAARASALRALDGSGRLKTSAGDLLPFNVDGLPNAGGSGPELFLAGDVRANEQVGLAAMHTLFVREHNRLVAELSGRHPDWNGDRLYAEARRLVIGIVQAITYNEFLPAILGSELRPWRGYDERINPRIQNEFSTAAFRFGHTLLSPTLLRLDGEGEVSEHGHLSLAHSFFAPWRLVEEGGIEPILRGMAAHRCQDFDIYVADEVRNLLFGRPDRGGFDLAALNIQRGRDHGLPGYNAVREAFGLPARKSFEEISSDAEVVARLRSAYVHPDEIDPWVGGLAEDALPGAMVGELVATVIADQFWRLREGDRYWYQNMLSPGDQAFVESSTLAAIIRRNSAIGDELPADAFRVTAAGRPAAD